MEKETSEQIIERTKKMSDGELRAEVLARAHAAKQGPFVDPSDNATGSLMCYEWVARRPRSTVYRN